MSGMQDVIPIPNPAEGKAFQRAVSVPERQGMEEITSRRKSTSVKQLLELL